jgi:hypothetical protein
MGLETNSLGDFTNTGTIIGKDIQYIGTGNDIYINNHYYIEKSFYFAIEQGDIADFDADLIALKYAQGFYGADLGISKRLTGKGISSDLLCPPPGGYRYVESFESVQSHYVLFVGFCRYRSLSIRR